MSAGDIAVIILSAALFCLVVGGVAMVAYIVYQEWKP